LRATEAFLVSDEEECPLPPGYWSKTGVIECSEKSFLAAEEGRYVLLLVNWDDEATEVTCLSAKFATGEIAEQVIGGFLRAAATDKVLRDANASSSQGVTGLTYFAGTKNVDSTREGIEKAITAAARK
jgi:hypothetical protein